MKGNVRNQNTVTEMKNALYQNLYSRTAYSNFRRIKDMTIWGKDVYNFPPELGDGKS